jgi:uncharacterized protein (DUF983 family)
MNDRSIPAAMANGARGRCPRCGRGRLFTGFLSVNDACPACGQELFHHRADDAPPYVVMFIVGHVVIGVMLWLEIVHAPPMWVHAAIFLPLTLLLSLALLPPVKGALVALQWANRMHGFDPEGERGA